MNVSPRLAVALAFIAFGATAGTHLGALPFLVNISSVTSAQFGILAGIAMLANIIGLALGGIINRHFDHRSVLLVIIPLCHLTLWFALNAHSLLSFGLSFVLLGYVLGTFDLFMNAEGAAVEQDRAVSFFSGYHGSATLGMAVCAILSSIVAGTLAPWCSALLAIVPAALAWLAVYLAIPHRPVKHHASEGRKVPLPRSLLTLVGLAAGLNVACEVAALQWAGQLLARIAPELAVYSGLGVAFYGLCGGSIRLVGDRLRSRYGDLPVLTVSISAAVSGFAVLGFVPGFWISVLAFAAVGFGLALVFPCMFALAAALVPGARAAAMSYVSAVGGVPRVILPFVLGWLATAFSMNAVFVACAVVASVALALIVATFRATAAFHQHASG